MMPGLINAHMHLGIALFKRLAQEQIIGYRVHLASFGRK